MQLLSGEYQNMFPLWIHQAFHMVKLARDLNGGFQGNPSVGFSDSIGYWVVVQFRTRNGLNSERGQMAQIGTR